MKRLIIVGSPRTNGRSAHLAEMLFEANIDERPEDELFLVPVSEVEIGACIGCNACREKSGVILQADDGSEVTEQRHRCIFDDDMQTLYDLIDDADEVTVVSPVYFSGAPAPFKCLLDRLQPYFWARVELHETGAPLPEKRPLELHVLGEGGDPHGFAALVSEVRAAFAVADFRLMRVLDWVGKIDEAGEITAEAEELDVNAALGRASVVPLAPAEAGAQEQTAEKQDAAATPVSAFDSADAWERLAERRENAEGAGFGSSAREAMPKKPRPKLNLHATRESDARPARDAASNGKPARKKAEGAKGASGKASSGKALASGKPPSGKASAGGKAPSGKASRRKPATGGKGKRRGK